MKAVIWALAASALAAIVVPAWSAHRGVAVAVAATPTPAALQYDEISRMVIPTASPPAPGSFQTDYQAIVATIPAAGAAAAATPAPRKQSVGGILGAVLSGNVPDQSGEDVAARAGEMMDRMRLGHLMRYTYYKGWLRTDDPVAQTATIEKCDQHQFITLNLANKTYTVTNTQPACPTTPMMPMGGPRREMASQPGTADMTIKATTTNLGPMTIDGIATTGSDRTMEMSMTNATGSCQNADVKMQMMQYVSQIHVPRAYCPLPHTAGPAEMVGQGGCKPTMHAADMQSFGSGLSFLGRLVIYSRMSMGASGGNAQPRPMQGMAMVTERGNVKWFSGSAADALFTIPPGFTQAQ